MRESPDRIRCVFLVLGPFAIRSFAVAVALTITVSLDHRTVNVLGHCLSYPITNVLVSARFE